jgi:hypothetical protein
LQHTDNFVDVTDEQTSLLQHCLSPVLWLGEKVGRADVRLGQELLDRLIRVHLGLCQDTFQQPVLLRRPAGVHRRQTRAYIYAAAAGSNRIGPSEQFYFAGMQRAVGRWQVSRCAHHQAGITDYGLHTNRMQAINTFDLICHLPSVAICYLHPHARAGVLVARGVGVFTAVAQQWQWWSGGHWPL